MECSCYFDLSTESNSCWKVPEDQGVIEWQPLVDVDQVGPSGDRRIGYALYLSSLHSLIQLGTC